MSRAVLFAPTLILHVQCSMRNVRLSTDHCFSVFQHATYTIYTILLDLGRVKPTGFAVCAHTFVRINLYAQDHTLLVTLFTNNWDSYGVLAANKNELAEPAFERASVLVLVLWSCWCCELAEFAFKTGGGAGRALAPLPVLSSSYIRTGAGVSWKSAPVLVSADCARCAGAVSWLCRLRTFLFQPVACQRVVGFCLAVWVYAGVIHSATTFDYAFIAV